MLDFYFLFLIILSLGSAGFTASTTITSSSICETGFFDNVIVSNDLLIFGTEQKDLIIVTDDCIKGNDKSWVFGNKGIDTCQGKEGKVFCEIIIGEEAEPNTSHEVKKN